MDYLKNAYKAKNGRIYEREEVIGKEGEIPSLLCFYEWPADEVEVYERVAINGNTDYRIFPFIGTQRKRVGIYGRTKTRRIMVGPFFMANPISIEDV